MIMKREEFEKKFSVNDKITMPSHVKGTWIKILSFEGEDNNSFTGKYKGSVVCQWNNFGNWELYKETTRKNYRVNTITKVYTNDQGVETLLSNSVTIEHLTEQQAIGRGLKIH